MKSTKKALVNAEPLAIPSPNLPYYLYTDARDTGFSAFLVQKNEAEDKEI